MTRVIVVGAGVMGTAFSLPLSDRGMEVRLVGTHLDDALVAGMKRDGVHARLRAPIGAHVTPYAHAEIADAFEAPADLIVCGVSTPGIDWAIAEFARHMRGRPPIVLLTKGISTRPDRIETLPAHMERAFGRGGVPHGPIGAVGGPCIAGELAVRRQTSAVIGFADGTLAQDWAGAMRTDYYHLRPTDDLVGLEVCAALKNFYTIGVSVPAGRAETLPAPNGAGAHNTVASLFNQAVTELALIAAAAGGRTETAYGLPGLGDLHVTCQAGRNARLGRLMGQGMAYSSAMAGPLAGETVEGTLVAGSLAAPLAALADAGVLPRASVPLAWAIIEAVTGDGALLPDLARMHA
jgi:glycerol-3-phosphate dehydrogenase (NAD(P)+)